MKQPLARLEPRNRLTALLASIALVFGMALVVVAVSTATAPAANADTVMCINANHGVVGCDDASCLLPDGTSGCTTTTIKDSTPTSTETTTTTTSTGCYDNSGAPIACAGECVNGVDLQGNACDQDACYDNNGGRVDCQGPCVNGFDQLQQPCVSDCVAGSSDNCPGTQDGCFDANGGRIDCIGECVDGKDLQGNACDPACIAGEDCGETMTTMAIPTTVPTTDVTDTTEEVMGSSDESSLAETGVNTAPLVWGAAGLLALGGLGLYLGRRRSA